MVVPQLVDGFIQAGFGRWGIVGTGIGLLDGLGRRARWPGPGAAVGRWVGSLCVHALAFLLSLLTGNVVAILVLLLTGFYVLSKVSLYLDGGGSDAASSGSR